MRSFKYIVKELRVHVPFTVFGALTGVVIMVIVALSKVSSQVSEEIFHILHPLHIAFSALVTTAMFSRYRSRSWRAWLIGYIGSIGICSTSDIFLPYLGGVLVGAEMKLHICFIEHWWLVNPSAVAGIIIGHLRAITKFPHAVHVLISTWASLFTLTAFGMADWIRLLPSVFIILFFAVWVPCCFSDIVFPLLFVKK